MNQSLTSRVDEHWTAPVDALPSPYEDPQRYGLSSSMAPIQEELAQLESLVARMLDSSAGACRADAVAAVDAAVRRARTKAHTVGHLEADTVEAAVEEATNDISGLQEVTAANAAVMQTMKQRQVRDKGDRSLSILTNKGASSRREAAREAAPVSAEPSDGYPAVQKGRETDPQDASSVMSTICGDVNASDHGGSDIESTAGTAESVAVAANEIVRPLRSLAQDSARTTLPQTGVTAGFQSLFLRKDFSGDHNNKASEGVEESTEAYNLDRRASSRGGASTPRIHGHCIAFGMDTAGKPMYMEPLDTAINQFSPMSPRATAANSGMSKYFGEGARACETGAPPGLNPIARVEGSVGGEAGRGFEFEGTRKTLRRDGSTTGVEAALESAGEGSPAQFAPLEDDAERATLVAPEIEEMTASLSARLNV